MFQCILGISDLAAKAFLLFLGFFFLHFDRHYS